MQELSLKQLLVLFFNYMKKYIYKISLKGVGEVFANSEEEAKEKALEDYIDDLGLSNTSIENELVVNIEK